MRTENTSAPALDFDFDFLIPPHALQSHNNVATFRRYIMSSKCLQSHGLYSKWRFEIFRTLFAPAPEPSPSTARLAFLHPPRNQLHTRRKHSTKHDAPKDESGAVRNATLMNETETTQNAPTGGRHRKGNASKEQPQAQSSGDEGTAATFEPSGQHERFDPRSTEDRAELRGVVLALKGLLSQLGQETSRRPALWETHRPLEQMEKKQEKDTIVVSSDGFANYRPRPYNSRNPTTALEGVAQSPAQHESREVPVDSPLLLYIADRRASKMDKKISQPKYSSPLYLDPWAQLLVGPIRQCAGSGYRLPTALQSKWSFVENEETQRVYYMPTSLADLEPIETYKGWKTTTNNTEPQLKSVQPPADHAPDDSPDAPSPIVPFEPKHVEATVKLIPHLNLMRQLTTELTKPFAKPQRGVNKAASKILPWHIRERTEQLKHFNLQRAQVAQKTGINPSMKPKDSLSDVGSLLDVGGVEWDNGIAGRMVTILRERCVAAIRRAFQLHLALSDTPPGLRRIAFTQNGLHDPSLWSPAKASAPESWLTSSVPPALLRFNGDSGRIRNPVHAQIEAEGRATDALFFLQVGNWFQQALSPDLDTPVAVTSSRYTLQYLPPTVQAVPHTPNRVPVFPLLPMLGRANLQRLFQDILTMVENDRHASAPAANRSQQSRTSETPLSSKIDFLSNDADSTSDTASNEQPQSISFANPSSSLNILFRRSAIGATSMLLPELWQLWRYLGGREALDWWEHGQIDMADEWVWGDPRTMPAVREVAAAGVMTEKQTGVNNGGTRSSSASPGLEQQASTRTGEVPRSQPTLIQFVPSDTTGQGASSTPSRPNSSSTSSMPAGVRKWAAAPTGAPDFTEVNQRQQHDRPSEQRTLNAQRRKNMKDLRKGILSTSVHAEEKRLHLK